jgi:hypothetical protein
MTSTGTEGRGTSKPELFRDFELILEQRMTAERIRRRHAERLGRFSLVLAGVALLATALMAYTLYDRRGPGISAGVVRTREVSLVDVEGRVRGRWAMLPEGGTRLSFLDDAGIERLRMTLLQSGAQGITLADSRGEGRVVLSLEGGEGSRLTFADAAGRPRTVLGLSSEQAGTLIFADDEATPRAAMGLEPDGRGTFMLPAARGSREPASSDTAETTTNGTAR